MGLPGEEDIPRLGQELYFHSLPFPGDAGKGRRDSNKGIWSTAL